MSEEAATGESALVDELDEVLFHLAGMENILSEASDIDPDRRQALAGSVAAIFDLADRLMDDLVPRNDGEDSFDRG